jgi:protein involved in polysaccharide export with SLBB domain
MNKLLIYLLFTLLVLVSMPGCTSENLQNGSNRPASGQAVSQTQNEYRLNVGDVIGVKFFYNPELNESVTVRPDGKISLQLIDEVRAAGLAPLELDRILTEKYSKRLRNAEVTIIVKEFADMKIYVGGEVNSVGVIALSGKLTLRQAIIQAGGFKNSAEVKNVVILRNQGTQTPLFMTTNLEEDMETDVLIDDIFLKPCDIVFVPRTGVAKLGDFVDQYIEQLVPANLTFGLIYNLNPEVTVK